MNIVFKNKYLSIDVMNDICIPDFTVLTGVNGSGKTHLLSAIESGSVQIDGLASPIIAKFNFESFRLESEARFNVVNFSTERDGFWSFLKNNHLIQNLNPEPYFGAGFGELVTLWRQKNCSLDELRVEDISLQQQLGHYKTHVKNVLSQEHLRHDENAQKAFVLVMSLPKPISDLSYEDLDKYYYPHSHKNNFLPLQLGKVFLDYYAKYDLNRYHRYLNETTSCEIEVVTDEAFFEQHGPKPWDVINKVLEAFEGLSYRVNSPEGNDRNKDFQLFLYDVKNPDLRLDFSNLSSGESVMMALVASVFRISNNQKFPDVLLLDEVDASLHPSMIKAMLTVIQDVFVAKSVKVILVTHSPTTVALSPVDSLCVMTKDSAQRIYQASKSEALAILTEGFVTLDDGMRLFDEVSKYPISIITEGNNTKIIEAAIKLYGIDGVDVISGVEGASGESQLKTMFDFFSKVEHKGKVIFIWDCDCKSQTRLKSANNTYPYVLSQNPYNTVCSKGIENMFSEELFEGMITIVTRASGEVIRSFDGSFKRDFEGKVLHRNELRDFELFKPLVDEINRIKQA